MVLREHGKIEYESDKSMEDDVPPLKDCSDVEYQVDKEILVIRRSFSVKINDDDMKQQKENIFHTRCHISNKVYSMIINSESCANVAIVTLVRKLNLNTIKHEILYRLQ
jgi:hypothetical protein